MLNEAIRRHERDDNIPSPVLPCSRASRQATQYDASSQSRRELSAIDQIVRVHLLTIRCLPYAVGNPHIRRRFRSRLDQNRIRLIMVTAIASALILSIVLWLARSLDRPTKRKQLKRTDPEVGRDELCLFHVSGQQLDIQQ
jgi:hypothetical protein